MIVSPKYDTVMVLYAHDARFAEKVEVKIDAWIKSVPGNSGFEIRTQRTGLV